MTEAQISMVLQAVVGLGLLNVWLVRARSKTAYRGGESGSLRDEFAAYGLPEWFFYLIGALKIGSAILLITGIWVGDLVLPAAGLVVLLMLGALTMHLKVKDPTIKSLPAFLMLLMSGGICALSLV